MTTLILAPFIGSGAALAAGAVAAIVGCPKNGFPLVLAALVGGGATVALSALI